VLLCTGLVDAQAVDVVSCCFFKFIPVTCCFFKFILYQAYAQRKTIANMSANQQEPRLDEEAQDQESKPDLDLNPDINMDAGRVFEQLIVEYHAHDEAIRTLHESRLALQRQMMTEQLDHHRQMMTEQLDHHRQMMTEQSDHHRQMMTMSIISVLIIALIAVFIYVHHM
jgi:hypothetical protein